MPEPEVNANPSTGIATRTDILSLLERLVERQQEVVVIVAKLEGMKAFNHAHGIRIGDELIEAVGQRMQRLAGVPGRVGSFSGDTFLIVVERQSSGDVEALVNEAAVTCSQPVRLGEIDVRPRLKIGIARGVPGESDVDQLMIEASAAMRAAEASRFDDVVTADQAIRTQAHIEAVVDRDLERALESDEIEFAYQPMVTLRDSVIHGAEALLRWRHNEVGVVDPTLLFERAEVLGLTRRFTKYCADRITSEWAACLATHRDLSGLSVSINLNEKQLADRECAAVVRDAVRTSGLSASGLVIEVVESGRIGESAEATLRALAEAGTTIVLDDFGTGFNALEYFLRFPVHGIKFDRSLTHSIVSNRTSLVIVQGVAEMADRLGVATVGEGIETADDAAMCRDLGLIYGQGWHFGRPESLADFVETARASRAGHDAASLHRPTFVSRADVEN